MVEHNPRHQEMYI